MDEDNFMLEELVSKEEVPKKMDEVMDRVKESAKLKRKYYENRVIVERIGQKYRVLPEISPTYMALENYEGSFAPLGLKDDDY